MKKESNINDIEKKITKLCSTYSSKIISQKIKFSSLLIEFADEYNKIWNNYTHLKVSHNDTEHSEVLQNERLGS